MKTGELMMLTLQDVCREIFSIKEAVDSIEVKGERNASFVLFCLNKCNYIINEFESIIHNKEKEKEEGEMSE
jgi:hypothetical protein